MNRTRFLVAALGTLALLAPGLFGQDAPKPENKIPPSTLKIQVTFSESQGEKKIANLPYTFFVEAGEDAHLSPWTKLRMGSRVPVSTGVEGGKIAFQYLDVGTNIDARGIAAGNGRYEIMLNLERSWVEGDVAVAAEKPSGTGNSANSSEFKEPIIRQFKSDLTFPMRDGQTSQTTQAADPLSGRILTITVTMNVVK